MRQGKLVAAFALGLVPGTLLYWFSRPPVSIVTPSAQSKLDPPSVATLPPTAAPPPGRKLETHKEKPPPPVTNVAELTRMLAERSHHLEAAQAAQADLSKHIHELGSKLEAVTQHEASRKAAEGELRDQLAQAQKDAEVLRASLQARETAAREMAVANQQLPRRAPEDTSRIARRKIASMEFEEVSRRRESYLSNILGRYREATELFRAMSLRLDNPRDAGSPLSNDLSRIQQAIQFADEDLRQLRVLSAQAARLQKELN